MAESGTRTGDAPDLRALQTSFWSLLSAPMGARAALSDGSPAAWLPELVVSDARGSSLERLEIYANMYFYRLRDNLALDFPTLAAVLGETGFHNLATDYLHARPSCEPSVRYVGQRLPDFLRTHVLAQTRPWLAELAALEWARVDVYDRADQPALTVEELQTAAASDISSLWLRAIAAHALVRTDHAVEQVWRAHARGELVEPEAVARILVVWRAPGGEVSQRALDDSESGWFARLLVGLSFVDLCELLSAECAPEEAAQRAVALVLRFTHEGLLTHT